MSIADTEVSLIKHSDGWKMLKAAKSGMYQWFTFESKSRG